MTMYTTTPDSAVPSAPPNILMPTQEEMDALLRQDFFAFTEKCFTTLNPAVEFKQNWHHRAIAHQLQEVMEGRCKRLIINIPPRYLKSIMCSVAFPAFILGHNPHKRIICASYGQDLSAKLSRDCRVVMESAWYNRLFPYSRLADTPNRESDYSTTERGGRFATSVGGVLTGLGGDIIIIDDPLKPGDGNSEKTRQAAIDWFSKTVSSRLDDKASGAIVLIMQRLHLDDLAGHLIRAGGWELLSIPAIATDAQAYAYGPGLLVQRKPGDVLQPERESEAELKRLKRTMGSLEFEAQYQQNPVPCEGAHLKREWFRFYTRGPTKVVGGPLFQSWDTASTANELSDYTACTTWYQDKGIHYLLNILRGRYTYPELKKLIPEHSHRWKCNRVLIEEKGSGQHLIQEYSAAGMRGVIPFMPKGDKAMRLATISPLIESGQVAFPREAPWLDDFITELLQFPNGRHDDQVDSLSQYLNYVDQRRFPDMWITRF